MSVSSATAGVVTAYWRCCDSSMSDETWHIRVNLYGVRRGCDRLTAQKNSAQFVVSLDVVA